VIRNTTNKILVIRLILLVLLAGLAHHLSAQSLVMVSGSGQMVYSPSFQAPSPLVVQANDADGNPLPGVAISWSISPINGGNTVGATLVTNSKGQASTTFTSPTLQPDQSFLQATVTATASFGSVTFHMIDVPYTDNGSLVARPSVTPLKPTSGATLTAMPGATLPNAVEVRVQAGYGAQTNDGLANVSVQMVNPVNSSIAPAAICNGPGGVVYTDSTGTATCSLVVTGQSGEAPLVANVGQQQNAGQGFELQINPGPACTYSISPTSQSFALGGGTGTLNVTTTSGCGWSASSNASWISITAGASGTGSGTVSYIAAADAGGTRSGTLTISGQTFTINEVAGAGGALAITTPATLPEGAVNESYSATLAATGGNPPYGWQITTGSLPAGLALNAFTGLISGAPTAVGTTSFTATVEDNTGNTASLAFSITIAASSSTFTITNPSFPNGIIGVPYKQALTSIGGDFTPFFQYPIFKVSGGTLPAGLSIIGNSNLSSSISGTPTAPGVSSFTLTATDAAQNATAANFTITITLPPTSEVMSVSPPNLSFMVQLGSATTPAVQPLTITGNSGVLAYTSVLTTTSGGNWLVAQGSTSGNTVGTIDIGVANYSSLQAGAYTGSVTISSQASNSPITVPVTLTVVAAPTLSVGPTKLTVSQGQSSGPNVSTHTVQVSATSQAAAGTDVIGFNASAATVSGGNWLSVSPSTGTTPASLTVSVNSGGMAIGVYTGTITVTPTSGAPETVTVTLNVINPQILSAAPNPVAFAYTFGTTAPSAHSVTLTSSAGPPLTVTAAVATKNQNNWLFVDPTSGATPLDLSVSVNPNGLTPGAYQGTITVSASDVSVLPLAIPVTLTISPAATTIDSVTNAASYAPGPVAPGEIVTIFGSVLGPATGVVPKSSGTIGTSLGGTEVFFNSFHAPILYSSAGQVSVIVPYELAGASSTNVQVEYAGKESAAVDVRVIDAVPGIFTLNLDGQGAIINQDGTVNSTKNGAPVGSTVSIYATGGGQTSPAGVDGAISADKLPLPEPVENVSVEIGGLPATVAYAGAAPGEVSGLLQVNATIPAGVPKGTSVPVVITVGTAASQAGVTVFVHP
jgi:uncharacterized protein (TIGR03437 family)